MTNISVNDLVTLLRSGQLRIRTGILLIPQNLMSYEADIAARIGISHQDICVKIIENTPSNKKLLGISRRYLLDILDSIIIDESVPGKCVLISGVDVLLAALQHDELVHFWEFFRDNYRRDRGVLISFPENAKTLLASDEVNRWNSIERITTWEDSEYAV